LTGFSLPFQLPAIENSELEFKKYLNFLISLEQRKTRAAVSVARPWDITLNVTTHCQLSCPYCETGNGSLNRSSGLLTPERFNFHMNPLYNTAFLLRMFGTGESLLNKQFPKMIEHTKGKEIFSLLSTNLSLKLSDRQIDELLQCGLGIMAISIDGASSQTYSQYRRGGDYHLVIANMQRLIARKKELGLSHPIIEWRFLVFEHNKHEIDTARLLAKKYGCDQITFHLGSAPASNADVILAQNADLHPVTSGPVFMDAVKNKTSILLDAIRMMSDQQRKIPPGVPRPLRYSKCDWLYFGTTLFPSGGVSPCCVSNHEENDFGSMDPETGTAFIKVWNNAPYREARNFFSPQTRTKKETVICARCPMAASMDSQFIIPLRAVLRNAPGWALKILACDPDRFFTNTDYYTLRPEMHGLNACRTTINKTWDEIIRKLTNRKSFHTRPKQEAFQHYLELLRDGDATDAASIATLQKGMDRADEIASRVIAVEAPDPEFTLISA